MYSGWSPVRWLSEMLETSFAPNELAMRLTKKVFSRGYDAILLKSGNGTSKQLSVEVGIAAKPLEEPTTFHTSSQWTCDWAQGSTIAFGFEFLGHCSVLCFNELPVPRHGGRLGNNEATHTYKSVDPIGAYRTIFSRASPGGVVLSGE